MPYCERISILQEAEIDDLYGVPHLSIDQKRVAFALNDLEFDSINSIRERKLRCYAIELLGYFKIKPIQLNPSHNNIRPDLEFIAKEYFPQFKIALFSVNRMQKARVYERILDLMSYQAWNEKQHIQSLFTHLEEVTKTCIEPRYLFDACIEYLGEHRITIPSYTVLQRIVSQAINYERNRIAEILKENISNELATSLADLVDGSSVLTIRELRQSAKSFSRAELKKEIKVYQLIQPWMVEVKHIVSMLSLSLKNQQHFASMIDYYSITKFKRFDRTKQQLYLLCYFHERAQQNIDRLADGFIYHVRKLKEKAKAYAKEMSYRDWESAAANVGKAADLLQIFIDDSIDEQQPFSDIKKKLIVC